MQQLAAGNLQIVSLGPEEIVIGREVVEGGARPLYIYADRASDSAPLVAAGRSLTEPAIPGIDTPEDLRRAEAHWLLALR